MMGKYGMEKIGDRSFFGKCFGNHIQPENEKNSYWKKLIGMKKGEEKCLKYLKLLQSTE